MNQNARESSFLQSIELELVREMIDTNFQNEDINPEKLEKIRKVLQHNNDRRRLNILIDKVRDHITQSAISLVPRPWTDTSSEFGTLPDLDSDFVDPQIQNKIQEVLNKYEILEMKISLDIKNIL